MKHRCHKCVDGDKNKGNDNDNDSDNDVDNEEDKDSHGETATIATSINMFHHGRRWCGEGGGCIIRLWLKTGASAAWHKKKDKKRTLRRKLADIAPQ